MARFRGTIKGSRGEASRLGTPASGLTVVCNGWDVGIQCHARALGDADIIDVFATDGSNGGRGPLYLGYVDSLDGLFHPANESEVE